MKTLRSRLVKGECIDRVSVILFVCTVSILRSQRDRQYTNVSCKIIITHQQNSVVNIIPLYFSNGRYAQLSMSFVDSIVFFRVTG